MSSIIAITFSPQDEGISQDAWCAWAAGRGLVPGPGSSLYYAGTGDARIEVSCAPRRAVTFARYRQGAGLPAMTALALELWRQSGGSLSATPELRQLIGSAAPPDQAAARETGLRYSRMPAASQWVVT